MRIRIIILSLLILISNSVFAENDDNGILLIDLSVKFTGLSTDRVSGLMVTNMATRKSYGDLRGGALQMIVVPEGFYCLGTIKYLTAETNYCQEPYFKVSKGQLNNAGLWSFDVNLGFNEVKLKGSSQALEQTLDAAVKEFPEVFKK
jgi:hypothetical protein